MPNAASSGLDAGGASGAGCGALKVSGSGGRGRAAGAALPRAAGLRHVTLPKSLAWRRFRFALNDAGSVSARRSP